MKTPAAIYMRLIFALKSQSSPPKRRPKTKKKDQAAATGSLKWPEHISRFFETLVSANTSISRGIWK
jgi:hypothetical protein